MVMIQVAAGKASHARQVEVGDPDRKRFHDSPGWGLGLSPP